MKNLILAFILFLSASSLAQSLESLTKSPEIYVYFRPCSQEEQIDQKDINEQKNGEYYYYYFGKNKYSFMMFSYMYSLKPQVRTENKSFLKKNSQIVIDYNFMKQYPLAVILKIFGGEKKIYLINANESNNGKIILKEVRVTSSIPFDM